MEDYILMKKSIRSLAVAGLLLGSVAACATPKNNYVEAPAVSFSEPPIGQVTTVSVGESMVSQGSTSEIDVLYVPSEVKIGRSYTVTTGYFPKTGEDGSSVFFGFSDTPGQSIAGRRLGNVRKSGLSDPIRSVEYIPSENKLCVVTVFRIHTCRPAGAAEQVSISREGPDNFQQTLYYNGRIGNKINIGYREFAGSLARPAFSNEVEYDITVSNDISYKGLNITVISADNNSIKYKLNRGFN